MKVICAWCLEEVRPALVREQEPLDDPEETHGVCAEHKGRLKTFGGPARGERHMAAPDTDRPIT